MRDEPIANRTEWRVRACNVASILAVASSAAVIAGALLMVYIFLVPAEGVDRSARVVIACFAGVSVCCLPCIATCVLTDAVALYPIPSREAGDVDAEYAPPSTSDPPVATLREIVVNVIPL